MRILLVDDEPANLKLLSAILESERHETVCVRNGQEALLYATEDPPELIIADILMPVMDGFVLCWAWMQDPLLQRIPFIFYTATYQNEEDEAFCLAMGASAFLIKPMEPLPLLASIKKVMQEAPSRGLRPSSPAMMEESRFLKLYNERLANKLIQRSEQIVTGQLALQESEASLRLKSTALEAAANGIMITDPKGTIQWANPAFCEQTGYTLAELQGHNPRMLKSGIHGAAYYRQLWETILGGQVWQGELINRHKNGTLIPTETVITPVLNEDGVIQHFVSIKQDITEQKRIQAELRQAQKMDALGRLAGGVAHDFNNMLSVILLNTDLLLGREDLVEPYRKHLLEIHQAGQRSADLTQQLLAFSRKQPAQPRNTDLNQVVVENLKMLSRLITEDIHLQFVKQTELWRVMIDPSQVNQILTNLVINARDALPGVGTITLETSNAHLDECTALALAYLRPGDHVLLTVSDKGCGMDAATLEHAFEPFFTTKREGKGTGLGLATVYSIVKQNHGAIYLHSEVGVGTTVKIYLPRFMDEVAGAPERPEETTPLGTETILVAEDEAAVLKIVRTTLEKQGYTVLSAENPLEVCRISEQYAGPIHLLLTDVVMPGMNGKELQTQLLRTRPDLKTVFMSGYAGEIIAQRGLLMEGTHFIQKPFRIRDLAKKVRETLDS